MEFLKRHYEKILLGVVLVGLAVAVAFLPFKIASEKQRLEDMRNTLSHPKVKPLTNLDLSVSENAIKLMAVPSLIDFSSTNRLFNPMSWQQTKDAPPRLIRSDKAGPTAAVATNITPLYLRITFDSVSLTAEGTPKYVLVVQREASPSTSQRTKKTMPYMKLNDKNEVFILSAVNGPPENPTNLVLTLNDTGESANVSKDQPYKRVDGYMADIRYDPEKKSWPHQRVGGNLSFNGEDYIIVAITKDEVVLSAKSNQKKWTVKSNAGP